MPKIGLGILLLGGCAMDSANMIYPISIMIIGVLIIFLSKIKELCTDKYTTQKNRNLINIIAYFY